MTKLHTSARGRQVDMTALQLANEQVVAVGNMGVNARGDQLGMGGKIVKTRAEIVAEHHALKAPMADNAEVQIPVDPLTARKISTIDEDEVPALKLAVPESKKGKKAT